MSHSLRVTRLTGIPSQGGLAPRPALLTTVWGFLQGGPRRDSATRALSDVDSDIHLEQAEPQGEPPLLRGERVSPGAPQDTAFACPQDAASACPCTRLRSFLLPPSPLALSPTLFSFLEIEN